MIKVDKIRYLKQNGKYLSNEEKIFDTSIYAYLLSEKALADKNPEALSYTLVSQTNMYAIVERDSKDYFDVYVISSLGGK